MELAKVGIFIIKVNDKEVLVTVTAQGWKEVIWRFENLYYMQAVGFEYLNKLSRFNKIVL